MEDVKEKKSRAKKTPPTTGLYAQVKDAPVKTVRKLIGVTERAMQERKNTWDRHRRKYRRGLFYLRSVTDGVPLYFTNYIFANVESTKANMTRVLPTLVASPRGFRDDLAADILTKLLSESMMDGGAKEATRAVVHNGLLSTMGWFKIWYDLDTENNKIDSIATEDVLVDPNAMSEQDARWIIHRKRDVPIDQVYADYGAIPDLGEDSDSVISEDRLSRESGLYTDSSTYKDAIEVAPVVDVYEAWIRCYDEGRENDWYIITIAGNTELRAEFSVYEHQKHVFVPWFDVEDYAADNIYHRGVGAVEEIEPLQDRADAIDLRIYKNISLLSNRQKYVSAQSGLNINSMDNTSGRTYAVNGDPQRAVFYDSPPQLSIEVYNYRQQTEQLIQTVSGIFDVTQGRRPTGITAGRAIESLKDSAETRLGAKAETLAESLQKVGGLALQNILQFFDGEKILKATDSDKDTDIVVIAEYPPELQPQPEAEFDPNTGQLIDLDPESVDWDNLEVTEDLVKTREAWKKQNGIALVLEDVKYKWDVRASTDSALPSAKAERGQIAADLFRLGGIDREALLEAMDFPNRHKILQRLAAEATGKSAGDPSVDGNPVEQMLMIMQQMGLPPEMIEQIASAMAQGGQPQQGGNFPPQMTM